MWNDVRLMNGLSLAMFIVALLGLCMSGATWAMRQPWFDLQSVVVVPAQGQNLEHVNVPQIRASAVPRLRGTLFTVDLVEARKAFESVPWVRRAVVSRRFPDGLAVEIEEHRPLATWGDGRGVNTFGELFAARASEIDPKGVLPEFEGPAGTEATVTQRWRDLGRWFAPIGLHPERVELTSRYAWRATLTKNDGGEPMVVDIGREQDPRTLEQRIARFIAHVDGVKQRWGDLPRRADLRYPNGFAVQVAGVKFLEQKHPQRGR